MAHTVCYIRTPVPLSRSNTNVHIYRIVEPHSVPESLVLLRDCSLI